MMRAAVWILDVYMSICSAIVTLAIIHWIAGDLTFSTTEPAKQSAVMESKAND